MRLDGLNLTEKMLAEDIKNFIEFFKTNSESAQRATSEAENEVKQIISEGLSRSAS